MYLKYRSYHPFDAKFEMLLQIVETIYFKPQIVSTLYC